MQDAPEDKAQGPRVSLPEEAEEAEPKNLPLGLGRPPGSAEPGQAYVQVQLDVE